MKQISVRFCMGCGYVCDGIQAEGEQPRWIDAHTFMLKHALQWEDLDRIDGACPPCARVLACARRGVLPDVVAAATP